MSPSSRSVPMDPEIAQPLEAAAASGGNAGKSVAAGETAARGDRSVVDVPHVLAGANPFFSGSFTWRNRLARGLWGVVDRLLFRPSPRPLHAWRGFLLRAFGAKLGFHPRIYAGARIWAPWNLEAGDYVAIADGATIYNMARLRLGDYSTVSAGAQLCGGSHDPDSANFQLVTGEIELGRYAWICTEAFVGPGVRIPEGAVLAARAVMMRSPPEAWTIYAGVPARALRARARRMKEHLEGSGAVKG